MSSKSGGTLETDSQRRVVRPGVQEAGIDAASRMVVVTDPGSDLEKLATEQGYRKVFLADPNVGGRYSALTAFGLVPTGLAGVDIAELLDEAEEVMDSCTPTTRRQPGARAGRCDGRQRGPRQDRRSPTLGSGIVGFADWAEQLIAESTGKLGKGVLPVAVEGPRRPRSRWPASDVVVAALVRSDEAAAHADRRRRAVGHGVRARSGRSC